jgi:hypothetical protein
VALLLLASAWFRRNLYTWVLLLPIGVWFVERRMFGTDHVLRLLTYRSVGFFRALGVPLGGPMERRAGGVGVDEMYTRLDATGLLASSDLWLGVLVAVAFLYLTVRIRRQSDDT